jgi:hypothetical protein
MYRLTFQKKNEYTGLKHIIKIIINFYLLILALAILIFLISQFDLN